MSTIPVRQGDCTFEEFLDLVEDGQKADLIDGAIYMASPDNTDAGDLTSWLHVIIGGFVGFHDLGKTYLLRVAYRIGSKRGPEPDIGVVLKTMESQRRRGFIDGPPALAIEIVSPDSVGRDYVQKRALYEAAGVQEYWIIDPDEERATFLRMRDGKVRGSAAERSHLPKRSSARILTRRALALGH
jgi:Uma2 family endonuclease